MDEMSAGSGNTSGEQVTLGRTLAALRAAHGWTQAELAEASGVDKAQISRYERGVDQPSGRTVKALVEALHAEPADLPRLQATLERIVGGGSRKGRERVVSSAGVSVLAELLGVGGSGPAASRPGSTTTAEVPPDDEVDRIARQAGDTVERLVRLHFAQLAGRAG